tara:strand:- start:483 stop:593 length:111 start_codon:yes stop_codon:yes gene_type:complete
MRNKKSKITIVILRIPVPITEEITVKRNKKGNKYKI